MALSDLLDLKAYVEERLGDKLDGAVIAFDELSLTTSAESIVSVLRFLRDDVKTQFVSFVDLCGVDYPERRKRFEVVYHLLSPRQNMRVRLRVATDAQSPVPSVVEVFPGADWFEREAYDMYGILFTGHPDLRRLLTDYGFEGHPLRKDFPVTGFSEVRYDDEQKRVVYEPVELRQEMRNFDFLSPWEGADYVLPGDEKAKKES
ncbi:MAG: NADH-quinone oxidoreductase subunit C [Rhizobiaceae bacterium]